MSNPSSESAPSTPALPYETPRPQWNAVTIGAIALKVLGLYCLIQAVPLVYVFSYVFSLSPGRGSGLMEVLASFVIFVVYLALAFALIWFAGPLAQKLFQGEQTHAAAMDMPVGPYLQAVAFSILGAWILVEGIVGIGQIAAYTLMPRRPSVGSSFVQPALRIAIGLFLVFRGPALALLWHKLRTAGTVLHEDNDRDAAT